MQYVIFAAACFLGQFMQTTVGFGLNILVMAIASTLFPVTTLASTCALLSLASCAYFTIRWRKKICLSVLIWPLITMLGISTLAIFTIQYLPVQMLKGFLGLALIALSLFFLVFQSRIHIRPTRLGGLAVGGIAGVLAGYFSTGGPPIVAYLLSALDDKEVYLASIQTVFLISNLWLVFFRGASGYLNGEVFQLCLIGYGCVALGAFLGTKFLNRLNFKRMRMLAYALIGLSGIWIVVSAWIL